MENITSKQYEKTNYSHYKANTEVLINKYISESDIHLIPLYTIAIKNYVKKRSSYLPLLKSSNLTFLVSLILIVI